VGPVGDTRRPRWPSGSQGTLKGLVRERPRSRFSAGGERTGGAGCHLAKGEVVGAWAHAFEETTGSNRSRPSTEAAPAAVGGLSDDAPGADPRAHLGSRSLLQPPPAQGQRNGTSREEAPRKNRRRAHRAPDLAELAQEAAHPTGLGRRRRGRGHRAAQLADSNSVAVQLDRTTHWLAGLATVRTVSRSHGANRRGSRRELASEGTADHIGHATHFRCEARRGAGSAKRLPPLVTLAPAGEMPVPRSPPSGIALWRPSASFCQSRNQPLC
jgi:hypothetical protein